MKLLTILLTCSGASAMVMPWALLNERELPTTVRLPNTIPLPTATQPPSATNYCDGNKVNLGDGCIAGQLPSAAPYSGFRQPRCNRAIGVPGSTPRISTVNSYAAADFYCGALIRDAVLLTETTPYAYPYVIEGAAEQGNALVLGVKYDLASCPTDKSTSVLDFSKMGILDCRKNMYDQINKVCLQDSTFPYYNEDYTLEGGLMGANCGIWAIGSNGTMLHNGP